MIDFLLLKTIESLTFRHHRRVSSERFSEQGNKIWGWSVCFRIARYRFVGVICKTMLDDAGRIPLHVGVICLPVRGKLQRQLTTSLLQPVKKKSGLDDARTRLQTVYFLLSTCFDQNRFTRQCEKEDRTVQGFKFALLLAVLKWHRGSKGVNFRTPWRD